MKFITDTIAYTTKQDEKAPPPFQPLTKFSLVIMVGLTGVGKSTVIERLLTEANYTLLPDRRIVTDEIIIGSLQAEDGETPYLIKDRVKRFEFTARYRAKHPGGMAYALSRLVVNEHRCGPTILFDGLRGLNEVQHAAGYFSGACFIVLDAPDMIRLQRLLKRGDSFDTTKLEQSVAENYLLADLKAIPDIETIFSEEQLLEITETAWAGNFPAHEVVKKVAIIVEERRNYDPHRARAFLREKLPPEYVLVIDTATRSPRGVAEQVREWLGKERSQERGEGEQSEGD